MEPSKSKTVLEAILYLGLLIGGLVFVSKDIKDYLSGTTNYSISKEPLTLKDLPTLTVCLSVRHQHEKIIYGPDFSIDIRITHIGESNATLQENKYVEVMSGLKIHLSELILSKKRKLAIQNDLVHNAQSKQCYKLSSRWHSFTKIDFIQRSLR